MVFCKNAVVCEMNKKLCLVIRLGDLRPDSHMAQVALSIKVIRIIANKLGDMVQEVIPLKISPNSAKEPCLLTMWPTTVMHVIDQDSPFYKMSPSDLEDEKFELHVAIEGVIESTNATLQAKTSYIPSEILWGHQFEPMMFLRKDKKQYQINFSALSSTSKVDTPMCSAFDQEQNNKTTEIEENQLNHHL